MAKYQRTKIGILGGSFDPPHKGHVEISKIAIRKAELKKLFWIITKQNPFKKKSTNNLKKRILISKNIIGKNKLIKIKYFEDIINSNKISDLVDHLNKNKKYELFFLMGADNLINFHKWHKWRNILTKTKLIVFDRHGYKKKSLNSKTYKRLGEKRVFFIKFNKVKISSSQLKKI